ncbi:membrane cofactor protein isoform X5 [Heterocephalus glaber]|uniref:Membrane cofactor protein n=1 Tax=Heterocephalus glaber TaxID=10181 RepID=A0AAX6RPN9_HETGA|nr:membrane cofactor protein isoform X5 [Heterocephalus glaber]
MPPGGAPRGPACWPQCCCWPPGPMPVSCRHHLKLWILSILSPIIRSGRKWSTSVKKDTIVCLFISWLLLVRRITHGDLLGPPPKITNGNYTFSDITMFQYFEAVTYSCNPTLGPDQLSLVGSEVLYCAAHETWSSAAPECKVIKCPSPVLKDGRQLSGFGKSFYYKAMVKFECMAGFYLNGSDTIMCGTENAWEPSIPQCIKGPRPTQPVKSPVYNYPGYPNPHEGLFDQELNVWISLLMLLVLVVAVAVLPLFVHRCVEHHNKSTKLTDDSHKEIKFTSL